MKGVFVLIVVGIETVVARAESREMAERTARRAEKNGEALRMRLAVPVLWQPAEPLVVHDFRLTNDATRTRFTVALRCG